MARFLNMAERCPRFLTLGVRSGLILTVKEPGPELRDERGGCAVCADPPSSRTHDVKVGASS